VCVLTSRERAADGGLEVIAKGDLQPLVADIGEGGDRDRSQKARFLRGLYLLRRAKPSVVHINVPWPNRCVGLILACAVLNVPAVVTHHLIPHPFTVGGRRRKLLTWARRRGQNWTAVSQYTRRLLCESLGWAKDEVECIHNGAPIPAVLDEAGRAAARKALRDELGLDRNAIVALTTGRLVPQKGIARLIQAAPHVLAEAPDLRIVIAGDGPLGAELTQLAESYGVAGRLMFIGQRSDVPRLLAAADLFVLPTLYEGFSLALLDAVAHGLPVVSTDASSIPELIDDRVHGLLCKPDDSAALAQAMRWAVMNPAEMAAMGARARSRAADFTEQRMVDRTLELLERTARRQTAAAPSEQTAGV
jgi:glycosyltransferase involved in cell wall biosynthesis